MKEKAAAILTIKDAQHMTPKGIKDITKWLKKQITYFQKYNKQLAPTFRARYLYR